MPVNNLSNQLSAILMQVFILASAIRLRRPASLGRLSARIHGAIDSTASHQRQKRTPRASPRGCISYALPHGEGTFLLQLSTQLTALQHRQESICGELA